VRFGGEKKKKKKKKKEKRKKKKKKKKKKLGFLKRWKEDNPREMGREGVFGRGGLVPIPLLKGTPVGGKLIK